MDLKPVNYEDLPKDAVPLSGSPAFRRAEGSERRFGSLEFDKPLTAESMIADMEVRAWSERARRRDVPKILRTATKMIGWLSAGVTLIVVGQAAPSELGFSLFHFEEVAKFRAIWDINFVRIAFVCALVSLAFGLAGLLLTLMTKPPKEKLILASVLPGITLLAAAAMAVKFGGALF